MGAGGGSQAEADRCDVVSGGGERKKNTRPPSLIRAHKSANIHDGCNAKRDTSRSSAASRTEARGRQVVNIPPLTEESAIAGGESSPGCGEGKRARLRRLQGDFVNKCPGHARAETSPAERGERAPDVYFPLFFVKMDIFIPPFSRLMSGETAAC